MIVGKHRTKRFPVRHSRALRSGDFPAPAALILFFAALLWPAPARTAEIAEKAFQILQENCFVCHGSALQMSKLDLRTRKSILTGGERGPALAPNYPERSHLYLFVTQEQKPEMPPGGKLSAEEIDLLRRWILAGAPEATLQAEEQDRKAELAKLEERPITEEERQYWAFQRPVQPKPPLSAENPIDAFLLHALKKQGLEPAPKAGKRELIRRAYLDLIGLPPAPEDVQAFVEDDSPDAFANVVERLLASKHYGERWGRHWLDLVHFAESGGYERDFDWPNMWRYRDYVIDAFNNDKPYDQFIREQIAGDEIAPESDEAHVATGYLRLVMDNNIKNERTRMDELDDYVSTTSLAFLGLTVGCARCHDHKFDPIPQKDYYRMQAIFFSTKPANYPLAPAEVVEAHEAANRRIDEKQEAIEERIAKLEEPYRKKIFEQKLQQLPDYLQIAWRTPPEERTEGQRLNARQIEQTLEIKTEEILPLMTDDERAKRKALQEEIKQLEKQRPEPYPSARTITEEGREPLPSYFLHRGAPGSKGSLMEPGVLAVVERDPILTPEPPPDAKTSWRRKALAEWIASPQNPLTARVMVNRIWQHHFGEGIVRTPSNFGVTGERPSHPELLDWLAVEFIQNDWSIKRMHRLMMLSEAYQRSSRDVQANLAIDPENRYFWRMPRNRLEGEIIRDHMLAVAGTLDRTVGGPSVHPYIDPDLFQSSTSRTWPGKPVGDPTTWRRSIYVFSKRSIRYPMFETFDQPDMVNSCARRNRSTVAPQALLLMNNDEVRLQAKFFAHRLRLEAGDDVEAQVERAFQLALARPPRPSEKKKALSFIKDNPYGLVDFCQAVFNLNEFVYRP